MVQGCSPTRYGLAMRGSAYGLVELCGEGGLYRHSRVYVQTYIICFAVYLYPEIFCASPSFSVDYLETCTQKAYNAYPRAGSAHSRIHLCPPISQTKAAREDRPPPRSLTRKPTASLPQRPAWSQQTMSRRRRGLPSGHGSSLVCLWTMSFANCVSA